jgi:prevent-host-death family protein
MGFSEGGRMTVTTMKSDEARQSWRDILDIASSGGSVVVERYNKPVAVMISYEAWLAVQEELEDLEVGARAQAAYERWQKDPSTARPWEDVEADLIADGLVDE